MSEFTRNLLSSNEFMTRNQEVNKFIEDNKIEIFHFNPATDDVYHGGSTVAMQYITRDTVEFAVSNCSKRDDFSKKIGKVFAVESLIRSQCVRIKIPKHLVGNRPATREYFIPLFASNSYW